MAEHDQMDDDLPLAAGDFSTWLAGMVRALDGEESSDVPCGTCTACCRSSQFVHVGPDEADTLAHIPDELLFPAPGLPTGHLVLGYDEKGRCPMLADGGCSIYAHRPRTCRTYDCRVYPAAGVEVDAARQPDIARQARRWAFTFRMPVDTVEREAVQEAARYVTERGQALPGGPTANPTQVAVLAVRLHGAFMSRPDGAGDWMVVTPEAEVIRE